MTREKQPIVQFTDTFAYGDVTGLRSLQEYELICGELGLENSGVQLVGSSPGDSVETAQQAVWYLRAIEKQGSEDPQIIAINNASRAKYKDLENAQGSDCLVCKVRSTKDPNIVHTIVGVDHDCFEEIFRYGNIVSIQKVTGVQYNGKRINDLSQGSQFRSLEYHPFVHGIYLKGQDAVDKHLILEDICPERSEKLQGIHGVKGSLFQNLRLSLDNDSIVSANGRTLQNEYLDELLVKQECLQLVGQESQFYDRRGLTNHVKDDYRQSIAYTKGLFSDKHVEDFNLRRHSLALDELMISSRDIYGNTKVMTAKDIVNGVHDIAFHTDLAVGTLVDVSNGSDTILGSGYLVNSIGEKTGEESIWTGSSQFDGMKYVELNRSFGGERGNQAREIIKDKPIGTVLKLKKK